LILKPEANSIISYEAFYVSTYIVNIRAWLRAMC